MAEIFDVAADQFLVFGVTLPPDGYGVVKNDMVNTMDVMPNSFSWPTPGPSRPIASLFFVWAVSLPIDIYSAVKRPSIGDHVFTFFGFMGLAIPNFIIALSLMYISYKYLGQSVGGLFSPEYAQAEWSFGKFIDLLKHLWIPVIVIVIGTAGTASLIRILRANLTDELNKPYVLTARSKGMLEHRVILKYSVRIALTPFVSAIGWVLPQLISGITITAIVLNLPTAGPLLLLALSV